MNKLRSFDDAYFHPFADIRHRYVIPSIKQVNVETGRFYELPNGTKYPSMSSVLKTEKGEAALQQWRDRVGEKEAALVSRKASGRGSSVHKLSELFLLGEKDKFLAEHSKAMVDALSAWPKLRKHLIDHITDIRGLEQKLFSTYLRLAGTADLICSYDGKLSVVDFKTSMKVKKREWIDGYFMQTDGYGRMWYDLTGEKPEQCVIIMSTDHVAEPQIFIEPYGSMLAELKTRRMEYHKKTGR